LDEAARSLAVDSCLADEGWVASLTEQRRPALVGLALGSAAMLAVVGSASQGSRNRQRAHPQLDNRRPRPRMSVDYQTR
jgi:hypothetical protein